MRIKLLIYSWLLILLGCQSADSQPERPNILLFITDDQSFAHTSMAGAREIATPAFDRIAREGIWFRQAFAASPGCSPSRAALLTGRHCWQIESAGTHASAFPAYYKTYPEILAEQGYQVGFTGKGWAPGNWTISGRTENPAGPEWNKIKLESPSGISNKDYAGNFEAFLGEREAGQPFCFWMGTHEPHRVFDWQIGADDHKDIRQVEVPAFLPDDDTVRQDLLDYYYEIEWADRQLARAIELLEKSGELDNTLIIVTSDNGMAFPRAKANMFEYGIHVPLAIRWGAAFGAREASDALVGFVDLAPTILEVCGLAEPMTYPLSGRSLVPLFEGKEGEKDRGKVFSSRERHSSSRYHSLSYPQRGMRTNKHLIIWNPKPERWPAGAPQKYGEGNYPAAEVVRQQKLGPRHWGGYHDIDSSPTLDYLLDHRKDQGETNFMQMAVGHRPEWELYEVKEDPYCLHNLALQHEFQSLKDSLQKVFQNYLEETDDPRLTGSGDIFENYPRYSRLRYFPKPNWAMKNPDWVPKQNWDHANPVEP